MSVKKGGKTIAGATQYHPDLFDFKWADHILNDAQWLMANPFSWQYGSMYQAAYANLSAAIAGKTLQSETVAGITVQFYLADDGHKICPADQESNVTAIYNATGVAWYYIIDTTNQRFKLPRTQFGFTGIRNGVGKFVEAGLPNITGITNSNRSTHNYSDGGAFYNTKITHTWYGDNIHTNVNNLGFDASLSNSIYGNSDTVQPKATEMYLYFYVGNFTQTALENTAGLNTELFNQKADLNLSNTASNIDFVVESQEPTAGNNYTWYRKYKSGWVEQGGLQTSNTGASGVTVTLPVAMADTNYTIVATVTETNGYFVGCLNKTTTSFLWRSIDANTYGYDKAGSWQVSGMAA